MGNEMRTEIVKIFNQRINFCRLLESSSFKRVYLETLNDLVHQKGVSLGTYIVLLC